MHPSFPSLVFVLLTMALSTERARSQETATASSLKIHFAGAGEYDAVRSLTQFKSDLEEKYRVSISTSFAKDYKSLPNLHLLESASVLVLFARRMNLPNEDIKLLRKHWNGGEPVIALQTACVAFQGKIIRCWRKCWAGSTSVLAAI
jgi:hypothetical protein